MDTLSALYLTKRYGSKTVVENVSLNLQRGEIVGLLGPNGAGKTTTFRMMVGHERPTSGDVYLNDQLITRFPMYRRARMGVGYLAQEPSIFRGLTVEENVRAILEMQGFRDGEVRRRTLELLEVIGIAHLAERASYTLSGGEKRRLEIARSLATRPAFMLLDEPFSGVDPIAVADIQQIIRDLQALGIGILITDHSAREILEVAERTYVIHQGRILAHGSGRELVDDPAVRDAYFGEKFYLRDDILPSLPEVPAMPEFTGPEAQTSTPVPVTTDPAEPRPPADESGRRRSRRRSGRR